MSSFSDRLIAGLGVAFQRFAGPLLLPLVEALTDPIGDTDELLLPTANGWPVLWDLDTTPYPWWLGQVSGVQVDQTLTLDDQRNQVRTRPATKRGTPGAVIAAVMQVLTGTKRVDLQERTPTAGTLTVRTYAAESAAGAPAIAAAATTQKPAGIVIRPLVATGATYRHRMDVHPGTYLDSATRWPTYADRTFHVPEPGTEF